MFILTLRVKYELKLIIPDLKKENKQYKLNRLVEKYRNMFKKVVSVNTISIMNE